MIDEEGAGHVAVEQFHLAVVVADGDTHAVGIGVGGEHEVRADLIGLADGQFHRRLLFGVGRGHGGEVAVGRALRLQHGDVGEAVHFQRFRHHGDSCAVQRGIDDAEVVVAADGLRISGQCQNLGQIDIIHLFANDLDLVGIAFPVDLRQRSDGVHLGDDGFVVRGHDLAAIVPVGLVAVILLRVVRGGHHHAGLAVQMADGKRQFGRGAQVLEKVAMNAVGSHHLGGHLGEVAAVVARVVRDSHLQLHARKVLLHVVGQPLRGGGHRVFVHAVWSDTHDAAQTSCAEFQRAVKRFVQFILVLRHQATDLILGFNVIIIVQPSIYSVHYFHTILFYVINLLNYFND